MPSWLVGYQLASLAAALVTLVMTYQIVRYRDKRGVTPLFVIAVGALVWIIVKLAVSLVRGTPAVFALTRLNLVGHALAAGGFVLFAIEYSGIESPVSKRTAALVVAEPALVNALIWVDLEWFWIPVARDDGTLSGYAWESTVPMQAHTLYINLMMLVGVIILLRFALQSASLYRRQTLAVVVGAAVPWLGNLLYLLGYVPVNLAPLGFAATGVALAWAVVWADFLNVAPIGRSAVVDDLYAGVLTMDADHQLVDINEYGRHAFDLDDGASPIGRHVDDLFAEWPRVRELYWSLVDSEGDEEFEVEFDGRYFAVEVTPLTDDRDHLIGRSLLVRDVTDRKLRQKELETTNERLERFASVVSHDLRNPLNVIDGRVTLARESDDVEPQLDAIEESADRMEAIIEDMLTLTRRGTDITFETISVADAARTAWSHVDQREATLEVTGNPTIEGDHSQVVQLFENLYRNAVEHGSTSPDSQARRDAVEHRSTGNQNAARSDDAVEHGGNAVTVRVGSLAADGGDEGFFVADDGPGIPADERDDVFEDGFTTSEDGTGLGLTIVSDIADAHGWDVTVTDSESGGARFEIHCPETDTRSDPVVDSTA